MKKILFVHHSSSIGGGSYCLLNILRSIDRKIIEPVVMLRNKGPLAEEIKKLGIDVFYFKKLGAVPYNKSLFKPSSIISYFAIWMSSSSFIRIIKEINPNVVYLNNVMLYPYLRSIKKCGFKSIIHIREHWPKDEHTHQLRALQLTIKDYADHIVGINQYSASLVPNIEGKSTIVYDWIDFTNRYVEHDLNQIFREDIANKKIFLYIGGLSAIKGVLEVFRAFSQIKGDEYRLLALGITRDTIFSGIRGKLKLLIGKMGWKTYSYKVYETLNSDKRIAVYPSIYEIKDIVEKSYCILSYFSIPHANLLLAEGLILGTPVVAARTPESMEYSQNGELAILFNLGNFQDFKDKILYFMQHDTMFVNKLKYSSLSIARLFNSQDNISKLHSVLENI